MRASCPHFPIYKKMKSSFWIILGFIAIILSTIFPVLGLYWGYQSFLSEIGSSQELIGSFGVKFFIIGAISQILFWGGIILATFGLIKYYKEK